MPQNAFHHHNDCPRCPLIGAEGAFGEGTFQFLALRFDLRIARGMCRPGMLHRVDPQGLARWLEHVVIDERHIDHLPRHLGPGIMATLPSRWGKPLIDGNHRAARALRDGAEFLAYVLGEEDTLDLLRRSIGRAAADHYWSRLTLSHPDTTDDRTQGDNQ